jgi:hypothetical protein
MLSMMPSLSDIGGGGGGQDTSGSWANMLKGKDGAMVLPGSVGQVDRSGLSSDGSLAGVVGGLGGHEGAGMTGFGSDYDDGADPVDADPYLHSLLDELMGTSQVTPSNMKWDPKLGWIETDTGMRMSEDEQYSQYMMMQVRFCAIVSGAVYDRTLTAPVQRTRYFLGSRIFAHVEW